MQFLTKPIEDTFRLLFNFLEYWSEFRACKSVHHHTSYIPNWPRPTTLLLPRSNGKPKAATAVYKLLMMDMRIPETGWAVFKRRAINLRNWCIWLVDSFEWKSLRLKRSKRTWLPWQQLPTSREKADLSGWYLSVFTTVRVAVRAKLKRDFCLPDCIVLGHSLPPRR